MSEPNSETGPAMPRQAERGIPRPAGTPGEPTVPAGERAAEPGARTVPAGEPVETAQPTGPAGPVPSVAGRPDDPAGSGTARVTAPRPREAADDGAGDPLVVLRDLKVHFPIKSGIVIDRTIGYVYAVDGVSLAIRRGQTYGLVGESGCGKTTLGRGLLRLVEPTGGEVVFDGVDVRGLHGERMRRMRRRMQMIFQDPLSSLDPRQSVQSLMEEGLAAHGLAKKKSDVERRLREALDAVHLPASALRKYPHEFSGGQRQRIGIARALVLRPELIVADEPVSALDVSIQAQVLNLLEDLQGELGLTYLIIAHDLAVVRHMSDTVGVMYLGGLVEEASSDDIYAEPLHPYTRALLSAVPVPDPVVEDSRERILLTGDLPSPARPPSGCRFHTRCPWAQPTRCSDERPQLREMRPGHRVACHWAEQIASGELRPHEVEAILVRPDDEPVPPAPSPNEFIVAP